jgi:HK97 gp10 family phage protein
MMSCDEFAAKLKSAADEIKTGLVVPTKKSMELVAEKAKSVLGTDGYGWAPHTDATVERWGEHGLGLLTGETHGTVGSEAISGGLGAEGIVYANTKQAIFFEMGTIHQPPRSFLYQSMVHSIPEMGEIYSRFAEKVLGDL